MRKKYRGKDIFEEETKEKSPLIPIVIFVSVILVLSVITVLVFSLLEKHTTIDLPWTSNEKKDDKKKPGSSRDQMDLVVPSLEVNRREHVVLNSKLDIIDIKKDKLGFLITFEVTTSAYDYATVEVKQVVLDGFYFTTTFAVSDRLDLTATGSKEPVQKGTPYQFRIKKTELDDIDMFGFNSIKLIYDIETPFKTETDREFFMTFNNELDIVNERTGLIQIDDKNEVVVSYYKTVAATDATYIYFDFENLNLKTDVEVYVKELVINNKIYDMSSFKDISHRDCREAIYLKIPTKEISRVNTMKVRFFLVETNSRGEKSFFITDEYSKAY